jgi:hypothetical protein
LNLLERGVSTLNIRLINGFLAVCWHLKNDIVLNPEPTKEWDDKWGIVATDGGGGVGNLEN